MNGPPDHEHALLLVLGPGDRPADAYEALLAHPDVVAYHLPPPWGFEAAGVDLAAAVPGLATITRENLPAVLDALVRLHTRERLDALCRQLWRETSEQVRGFYLRRSVGGTLAAIFRLAPRSAEMPPPPDFVQAQVFVHAFVMEYRLRRGDEPADLHAPPEEGSLVLYPFDPRGEGARAEAGLAGLPPTAPVLEAFAYASARARHRQVLEEIAWRRGWRVVDTARTG